MIVGRGARGKDEEIEAIQCKYLLKYSVLRVIIFLHSAMQF